MTPITPAELDELERELEEHGIESPGRVVETLLVTLRQAWSDLAAEREACAQELDKMSEFLRTKRVPAEDKEVYEFGATVLGKGASAIRNRGSK